LSDVAADGGSGLTGGWTISAVPFDDAFRRRGLASRVLARLETGPLQPEAAALYGVRGYERIPVFGPYPDALAFEKPLGRAPD
jgi:hypothetical protein